MTRANLLTAIADTAGGDATVTATADRYKRSLNRRHREILSWPGSEVLRQRQMTLTSVADQALYALPHVENIGAVRELTNDRELSRRSLAAYRRFNPDPATNTGLPEFVVPIGYQQVALQPSDASELWLDSTSASDTQTAYVEGFITGGYPRSASVSLTGTTALTLSSAITSWVQITKFYLSTAAVGVVTLLEDSGTGTELARIGIGQTQNRYFSFYLDPTPSEALTFYFDALYQIPDLAQDTDEPFLPSDYHDLLVDGVLAEEFSKKDDTRARWFENRWNLRGAELRLRLARMALDESPAMRTSRLGSWVESGAF